MKATPKPFDMKRAAGTLASRLTEAKPGEKIIQLPLDKVIPRAQQHRKFFDPEKLQELANSIKFGEQEQPIVVYPNPNVVGGYIIISGERRWRACGIAKIGTVKAVIRQLTEDDADKILLSEAVENWQRENLTAAESITLAVDLVGRFGLAEASQRTGKDKPLLSRMNAVGKAPDSVREWLDKGLIEDVQTLHRLTLLMKESEADAEELMARWRKDSANLVGARDQIDAARKQVADRKNPPLPIEQPPKVVTAIAGAGSTPKADPKTTENVEPPAVRSSPAMHTPVGGSGEPASVVVPPVSTVSVDSVRPAARSQQSESGKADNGGTASTVSESDEANSPILVPVSADFQDQVVVLVTQSGPIRFDRAALVSVLGLNV